MSTVTGEGKGGPPDAWESAWRTAEQIPGWLKEGQARMLWDEARRLSPRSTVLEIGSHQGRSTVVLAEAVRAAQGTVIAMDPFVDGRMFGGQETATKFHANVSAAGLDEVVEPLEAYSTDAVTDWDRPLDLLYIDGKHDYWTFSNDLKFARHLPPRGVVVVHDSFSSIGVTLGILRHVLFSRDLAYERRSESQALFRRRPPGAADRLRVLRELPWWIGNVFIKVLLRLRLRPLASWFGHDSPFDPY